MQAGARLAQLTTQVVDLLDQSHVLLTTTTPWASTPLEHWGVEQVERQRRENPGAVYRRRGGGSGEGLCPFPENL